MEKEMTEVAPAKPDVKPKPERQVEPKPRPRRGDPWTVPAPKVNPTPKATNRSEMCAKTIITNKEDFKMFKDMMKPEAFNKKYTVSTEVVSAVLAEEAMVNLYFTDSRELDYSEVEKFKKSKGLFC